MEQDIHNPMNACLHREHCRKLDQAAAELRKAERAAVLRIVHRFVHTSHFMRIEAAVEADAHARCAA